MLLSPMSTMSTRRSTRASRIQPSTFDVASSNCGSRSGCRDAEHQHPAGNDCVSRTLRKNCNSAADSTELITPARDCATNSAVDSEVAEPKSTSSYQCPLPPDATGHSTNRSSHCAFGEHITKARDAIAAVRIENDSEQQRIDHSSCNLIRAVQSCSTEKTKHHLQERSDSWIDWHGCLVLCGVLRPWCASKLRRDTSPRTAQSPRRAQARGKPMRAQRPCASGPQREARVGASPREYPH